MPLLSKRKFALLLVLVLVALNVASIGMFWLTRGNPGPPPWGKRGFEPPRGHPPTQQVNQQMVRNFLIRELAFDDDQIRRFDDLREAFFQEMAFVNEELADRREELYRLLAEHPVDSIRIKQDAQAMGALEEQLALLIFYHFQEVKAFCTPAQQERFDALIDELIRRLFPFPNRQRHHFQDGRDLPIGP